MRYIRQGAQFVLTNPDHLLPWNGELTPGAGTIAAAIERASGCSPVVIGKPSPIIMQYAIARLGLPAEDIWAVGDNLNTDIRGGRDSGPPHGTGADRSGRRLQRGGTNRRDRRTA
ncbi:HAD hydrolase-like protein [Paenibacillus sp. P25]|nr:HAD hydrolase-like protein [Paenibacillus sp. P25]